MRLLGGVLPWIGFRVVRVPCQVAVEAGIKQTKLVEGNMDEVYVESFEVEWFGHGISFAMRGIL